MKIKTQYPINDIHQCIVLAQALARETNNIRHRNRSLRLVFNSLAGNETTGFLAFAIWRGRSQFLSSIQPTSTGGAVGVKTPGASHALSYWHEENVAFGDLPIRKRSIR